MIKLNGDPFLSGFSWGEQHHIISAFTSAIRANDVQDYKGASSTSPPVSDTVRATIDAVAQTYRAHNCPSPIHDDEGKLAFLLQHQLKGYKNTDASCKPQKALMPKILHFLHHNTLTKINRACGELADGAFFFAMCSCEYLKTTGECHMKLLCLRNLQFYRDKKELHHSHPNLHLADCIAITFEFQKNDEHDATVMMHRTLDLMLGPIKAWAAMV